MSEKGFEVADHCFGDHLILSNNIKRTPSCFKDGKPLALSKSN